MKTKIDSYVIAKVKEKRLEKNFSQADLVPHTENQLLKR